MPKDVSPDSVPVNKAVLAAGAVLWRPNGDCVRARGRDHPPPSLQRLVAAQGQGRPRRDRTRRCRARDTRGDRLLVTPRQAAGRRQLSGRARHEKGAVLGGAALSPVNSHPNAEVDELKWLPVAEAMKQLEYPHDRKVLRRFAEQPVDTQTVLIVRHGTAGSKSRYKGDDRKRPLDKHGRAQAESLVGVLLAFGANTLYAGDRVRCHQTLEPLAEELGVTIHDEPLLTEEAYAENRKAARHRFLEIAAAGGTPVICTQGRVIPDLIAWWCERDEVRPDKSRNRKGSTWVLSLVGERLVAADHIGSPLATKK